MGYREIVRILKEVPAGRHENCQLPKFIDYCSGVVGTESLKCLLLPNDVPELRIDQIRCEKGNCADLIVVQDSPRFDRKRLGYEPLDCNACVNNQFLHNRDRSSRTSSTLSGIWP